MCLLDSWLRWRGILTLSWSFKTPCLCECCVKRDKDQYKTLPKEAMPKRSAASSLSYVSGFRPPSRAAAKAAIGTFPVDDSEIGGDGLPLHTAASHFDPLDHFDAVPPPTCDLDWLSHTLEEVGVFASSSSVLI